MLVLAEPKSAIVRARWSRAAGLGVARDSAAYPVGASDVDLAARRDRLADVFREGRRLLAQRTEELSSSGYVALVADHEGVILSARAGRDVADPATRARLVEGARWGEETRGTNAIGTALAEGHAVTVLGGAHFEVRNRGLFCCATPIRDAYGDVVAVLDVSGPVAGHTPSIGVAVEAAGRAIERALRALAYEDRSGALRAIERLLHRSDRPELLVEASGAVRAMNVAARRALSRSSDALIDDGARGLTCERVFGSSFAELRSAAEQRGGARFETDASVFRVELDPIAGDRGRTLALLVHLDELPGAQREVRAERRAASVAPSVRRPSRGEPSSFDGILGEAPALVEAKKRAARFANTALPVLLLAETGTGKELFARAIHAASARREAPFVAVNCGALPEALISSELFGHAPGAFTGASRGGMDGRIAAADGGTLFLDEIAEMAPSLQAALLRVLDEGVYQRVGESRDRRASFRLVCATCRDLPALVESGRFRSDLFYRIHGACVTIPPLRERGDAVWLAARFVELLGGPGAPTLGEDARRYVAQHSWPGNVRELKSAVTHALALARDAETITALDFPTPLVGARPPSASAPPAQPQTRPRPQTRSEIVDAAVRAALEACGGNVSEAARRLGVGRGTVYRAMRAAQSGDADTRYTPRR